MEPPAEEKLELIVAKGICMYANANRAKNSAKSKPSDFMYPDLYKEANKNDNDTIRSMFSDAGLSVKNG